MRGIEHDFGYWLLPNGQRGRVAYNVEAETLYLFRPVGRKGRTYEVLAEFPEVAAVRALLEHDDPWWDHADEAEGLAWLLGRLDTYERAGAR